MNRREFVTNFALGGTVLGASGLKFIEGNSHSLPPQELKLGIIGLSPHSASFATFMNDPKKSSDLYGCRISKLYHPPGNPDVEFTQEQLANYRESILAAGVNIVSSIDEVLKDVEGILIETNDGRPHLAEVMPVFQAGLPVFVDKPVAENMKAVLQIYEEADRYNVPIFSSSSLRYGKMPQMLNQSMSSNRVIGAQTYSPAPIQEAHTDLYWYGIHGVEMLYTVMGQGCKEVRQIHHSDNGDMVVGIWDDERMGSFRGIRKGRRGYGGTAFLKDDILELGGFEGYRPLVVKIVEFFNTKIPPVTPVETLEIYAFMEAAQKSKGKNGKAIKLSKFY